MWDEISSEERGFTFDTKNGIRDLNDLIPLGSGWVLTCPRDINNSGQIVGLWGFNGEKRRFILDPVNPAKPWVYMLLLGE